MSHKPTFQKENRTDLSDGEVSEQDIITLWKIIDEAFEGVDTEIAGGELSIEMSDDEISLPASLDDFNIKLEELRQEKVNLRSIRIRAFGMDKDGNFKDCTVIFWFGSKIIASIDVHSAGEPLSSIRSWGLGLYSRIDAYIKKIGPTTQQGKKIGFSGEIKGATEKEKQVIQKTINNNLTVNAQKISRSRIIAGNNKEGSSPKGPLEKLSLWFVIIAGIIAFLTYVGIKLF